jgi:hypothetical protein
LNGAGCVADARSSQLRGRRPSAGVAEGDLVGGDRADCRASANGVSTEETVKMVSITAASPAAEAPALSA